jgi:uncharacterized protein YaaW (UPF0174 family)
MGITTQKHINIIDELRERAIRDKAQLNGSLLPDEKDRFTVAIDGLEATKKRMMIDLLEQEKQNVTEELDKLNA